MLVIVGRGPAGRVPPARPGEGRLRRAWRQRGRVRLAHPPAAVAGQRGVSRPTIIAVDNLTINLATYQVKVGGEPLDLTYLEYALLAFLVTHPGRTYSRDALLRRVWGFDYYGGSPHRRRARPPRACQAGTGPGTASGNRARRRLSLERLRLRRPESPRHGFSVSRASGGAGDARCSILVVHDSDRRRMLYAEKDCRHRRQLAHAPRLSRRAPDHERAGRHGPPTPCSASSPCCSSSSTSRTPMPSSARSTQAARRSARRPSSSTRHSVLPWTTT